MDKTKLAKTAVSFIIGGSTAKVIKEIIKNNTRPESTADKAAVVIASYVLGTIIADQTKVWTDEKIDKLIAWWIENVTDKTFE